MVKTLNEFIEELQYLNSKLEELNKKKKEIEDKKFTIWAARIVGSLFVLASIGNFTEDPKSSIITLLIFLPVTIWGFRQNTDFSKVEEKIKKLENKIIEELKELENNLKNPDNFEIKLEEINVNIKKEKNEKFYFGSFSYLIKSVEKEIDYGGVVGTPVRIFGQTVIVGGGGKEKKKVEELEKVDEGDLYISNKRILFLGNMKKYEIKLNDLLSFTPNLDYNIIKIVSSSFNDVLFLKFKNDLDALKSFVILNILTRRINEN
jgi:cell division protein ZapA (FtsZ GTPase activity inhibitor)